MHRGQNEQNLKAFAMTIQRHMGVNISNPLVIYSPSEFRPVFLTEANQRKDVVQGCDLWKLSWGGNWNEVEMAALPPFLLPSRIRAGSSLWKLLHHHLLDVSALNNFRVAF